MKKPDVKKILEATKRVSIVVKAKLNEFRLQCGNWWASQPILNKKIFSALVAAVLLTNYVTLKVSGGGHAHQKDHKGVGHERGEHKEGENEEGEHEEGEHEEGEHEEGVIELSAEQIEQGEFALAKAAPGTINEYIELPAEVVLNADRATHVNPRYSGVVKAVYKYLGDTVKAGDSLAVIESNAGLQQYTLKSSLDGTVIKRDINTGEFVTESAEVFAIADLSSVWVNMTVYQKDLGLIQKGQDVIVSAGEGSQTATGQIFFAAPIVDEKTRTALAAVKLENKDMTWKPGQFVTARVITGKTQAALVVARSGVQTVEDKRSVFVKTEKGFQVRHLQLGKQDAENYEVLEGLKAGDEYASKNSFVLKAEAGKGEAEHEH